MNMNIRDRFSECIAPIAAMVVAGGLSLFTVGCVGGSGSAEGSVTIAPSVPTVLTVTAASSSQINLSWSPPTDDASITGYKIYRGGTYLKSVITASTSDIGLSASTHTGTF